MGRPKKQNGDLRQKWAVLNVTGAEREAIQRNAAAVDLSISAYIVRRALQEPAAPRRDWQRIVQQQAQLLKQLNDVAAALLYMVPPRDVGCALLALRRIETEITAWTAGAGTGPQEEGKTDFELASRPTNQSRAPSRSANMD